MKHDRFQKLRQQVMYGFELLFPEKFRENVLQALPFWVASLLAGLVAVGYARLFGYAEQLSAYLFHSYKWSIFLLMPLCFSLAWWIVQWFAPNARGSGIPQVMAAIDLSTPRQAAKVDKLLGFRIMVTKIASSLVMVLGGAAVGREGPTIQIAGSVFHLVNKWIPARWPRLALQNFILTGAAAGLAAAFNTPLGGLVFAMEELARIHVKYFRTALFSAVIIAGLTAQAILGPYLYLGYPDVGNLRFTVFFGVAATAVLGGLGGAAMCRIILRAMKWRSRFNTPSKNLLFLAGAALLLAGVAFFLDHQVMGSGKEIMNKVLFTPDKSMEGQTVLWRIFGPVLCFITGGAGGVFAPALAAGASIGAYVADLSGMTGATANILILSGMVGFLTGVTRTPFTSAILVLEMTDRHSVIFHLLLAALAANLAALLVDGHSFYDQLKKGYLKDALGDGEQGNGEKAKENRETEK
ncbi:chloride channel protein [Paraflavisolibacter sp. H34]|uniref:chloride channel protein n=1 Tax=Huijunlia imazamoxiresistens TaxID=3127457 RepID=UPI00301643C4